jgi:class III poly(R)-hydroxyalkanoic acid synthase PhaE subunit
MNQDSQEKGNMDSLLAAWMKSATDFWMSGAKMWSPPSEAPKSGSTSVGGFKDRTQESWQNAFKLWQGLLSSMSTPESVEAFLSGASTSPEIAMKIARTAMEGYSAFYQQWLKKMGNLSEPGQAYHFENLDQNTFKAWRELYEKEIRPFLKSPQLGLTRSYQERMNEALDSFNLYQTAVAEFFQMLSLPVEKSLRVMEEKLEELSREGKLSENFKDYYDMWVKVLEGHYMTLFKSPEYLQSLSNTLNAIANFKTARHKMLVDILQFLPIPTNKDMDELYKEIYLLKKTVKEMKKKMAEQETSVSF